jgi:hypothetical protein
MNGPITALYRLYKRPYDSPVMALEWLYKQPYKQFCNSSATALL